MDKKITRICVVDSVFALVIYLLISTEEDVKKTHFFMSSGIQEYVRKKFINNMSYIEPVKNKHWVIIYANILKIRIKSLFKWRYSGGVKIFAQDHLYFSSAIIGKHNYTLLSDGPKFLTLHKKSKYYSEQEDYNKVQKNMVVRVRRFFLYLVAGSLWNKSHGKNSQCKKIILSERENVNFMHTNDINIVNIKDITHDKLIRILNIFDLSEKDIKILKDKTIIVLTQPFSTDKVISEIEQKRIYEDILSNYNYNDVVIKTHPRDTFDYRKYFNDVYVMDKPIPMQLLDILNIVFQEAATVCSSAATSIPYNIKVRWLGSSIHPNILKEFGDL